MSVYAEAVDLQSRNPGALTEGHLKALEAAFGRDAAEEARTTRTKALRGTTIQGPSITAAEWASIIAEAIEMATDPLHKRIGTLERRLAEIEGKGLSFEGLYEVGRSYRRGMTVVRHGSLFIASAAVTNTDPAKPTTPPQWMLAASRGRDGKDAR
jgi:hypothetical protein